MIRESKQEAKEQIKDKIFKIFFVPVITLILANFIVLFIVTAIYYMIFITSGSFNVSDLYNYYITTANILKSQDSSWLSTITNLILIPLNVGMVYYYLKVAKDEDEKFISLFAPYKRIFTNIIVMAGYSIFMIIGFILFIIPGVYIALKYAFIPFVLMDEPDLSISETFTRAGELSDGEKSTIFSFILSFFLWIFLIIISLGLALIYLIPYFQVSFARLYLNIKEEKAEQDN